MRLLERKSSDFGIENRLTAVDVPPPSPRDIPLSTKFGTKIPGPVAVA
jgi:hypothetical protein